MKTQSVPKYFHIFFPVITSNAASASAASCVYVCVLSSPPPSPMQRKTILTGIAVMTIALAGCNASAKDSAQVRVSAERFYSDWTDSSSNEPLSNRFGANAPVTTRFRNRLSALLNDNQRNSTVLCGRDIPTSFDVSSDVQMTGDNTATVTVTQHFASGDVPVQVSLIRQGSANSNAWFIDEVNCGNNGRSSSMMSSDSSAMTSSSSLSSSSSSQTSSSSAPSTSSSSSSMTSSMTSTSSPSQGKAGRGQFCGGIAGIQCATGLTCQYEGTYPDAGGTCI